MGRARIAALACASGLALAAAGAGAETYRIVSGELTDAATGETEALAGGFEASLFEQDGLEEPQLTSLGVDDFELRAGSRTFTPSPPIEFEGLTPCPFLEVADQIQLREDDVVLLHLRSGGEVVAASGSEVTFRFLDFRSDASDGGRAAGYVGDTALPQRFWIPGTLHEVDQTFRIASGGSVVVEGGGALISWERFDIADHELVTFVPPAGGATSFGRVTGGSLSTIEGALLDNGSVHLRSVLAFDFAATSSPVVNPFLAAGPRPVIIGPPPGGPICDGLRPVFPAAQREVGRFALVAAVVQPIDVDVNPRRDEKPVRPGHRQPLSVAILGSEAFDVRDVDERSLRLGLGEAEAKKRPHRRDVNHDGHRDLVARFDVSETGIAFGDSELCLVAETKEGVLLEGCDAIETWPEPRRKAARSH